MEHAGKSITGFSLNYHFCCSLFAGSIVVTCNGGHVFPDMVIIACNPIACAKQSSHYNVLDFGSSFKAYRSHHNRHASNIIDLYNDYNDWANKGRHSSSLLIQ